MSNKNDFMQAFLRENETPAESIRHFTSIPWTSNYMNDPAYEQIATYSRVTKPSGEDYFFSKTINSPSTIAHYVTLRLKDYQTMALSDPAETSIEIVSNHKQVTSAPNQPDCIFLLSLGKNGIDGHPGVVHGGIVCAILDETMGLMVMLHHDNIAGNSGPRDLLFTINLNVSYRAPVPSPADVVVKTWLVKRGLRKWYTKGQIYDQGGKLLSEADGLWLLSRSNL